MTRAMVATPDPRNVAVSVKFSGSELDDVKREASLRSMSVSEYLRYGHELASKQRKRGKR